MILIKENGCTLYCSCGCHNGILFRAEDIDEFGHELALVSDVWYTSQQTAWSRFKEKCRRIWHILRNKEHYYYSICIDAEDMHEFQYFISKIGENRCEKGC